MTDFMDLDRPLDAAGFDAAYEDTPRVLAAGGSYHLLVFSEAQPGDWGPRRVRHDELDSAFADGEVRTVERATFQTNVLDGIAQAWRATLIRRD